MENKTIYAVNIRSFAHFTEIEEWEIVKETPKTYVIQCKRGNGAFLCGKDTIKKEKMENLWYKFRLTYKEALECKARFLVDSIDRNNKKIDSLKSENKKMEEILFYTEKALKNE